MNSKYLLFTIKHVAADYTEDGTPTAKYIDMRGYWDGRLLDLKRNVEYNTRPLLAMHPCLSVDIYTIDVPLQCYRVNDTYKTLQLGLNDVLCSRTIPYTMRRMRRAL